MRDFAVKFLQFLILNRFLSVCGGLEGKEKFPYLIECLFEGIIPTSVSLVKMPCDHAENNMAILDIQPPDGIKKRFGVCSKRARFEDRNFAIKFIEWMHMMRILGAEKIHFFYDFVHPDTFEIFQYYGEQGILETLEYLNPTGIENSATRSWQSNQVEVTILTDCFFRVKNLYDYVAIVDMDEVIMPLIEEDMTWEDIIKRVDAKEHIDAYVFQNAYYPEVGAELIETIPSYMHMLQHVQRSKKITKPWESVKSFFNTGRVLTIHNHYPHHCLTNKKRKKCTRFAIPPNISQSSHYRDKVDKDYRTTIEDSTIWKFKERLLKDVQNTLAATKFAP